MIKSLSILCFAAALAFSQTASGTRTPPTPAQIAQRQVERLTTLLTLTADQQAQATTIFTTAATSNATIHSNMKTAHATLKTAIENNDTAAINQTATTIGTLEGQSVAATALADGAFYSILTADQKTKYASLGAHGHFGGGFGPAFRGAH